MPHRLGHLPVIIQNSIQMVFYPRDLPWMHDLTIPHCLTWTSSGASLTVSHFPLALLLSSKHLSLPEATLFIVCSTLYYLSFPLGFTLLESSVSLTTVSPMSKAMLRNLSAQYIFVKWSNKPDDTSTSTSSTERSITCLNHCSRRLAICMLRYVEGSKWEIVLAVFASLAVFANIQSWALAFSYSSVLH